MTLTEPTLAAEQVLASELEAGDVFVERRIGWSYGRPSYCHAVAAIGLRVERGETRDRNWWVDALDDDGGIVFADGPSTRIYITPTVTIEATHSTGRPGRWGERTTTTIDDCRIDLIARRQPAPSIDARCYATPGDDASQPARPATPTLPPVGEPAVRLTQADWSAPRTERRVIGRKRPLAIGRATVKQLDEIAWRCEQLGIDPAAAISTALRDRPITMRLTFPSASRVVTWLRQQHRRVASPSVT